jgi:hypothetical protein
MRLVERPLPTPIAATAKNASAREIGGTDRRRPGPRNGESKRNGPAPLKGAGPNRSMAAAERRAAATLLVSWRP